LIGISHTLDTLNVTTPPTIADDAFDRLMQTIIERRDGPADRSYTQKLLIGGTAAIGSKIVEEAGEVVESATHLEARRGSRGTLFGDAPVESGKELGSTSHLVHEAVDLVYHLWVMLAKHQVSLDLVRQELDRRAGVSGLIEKENRPRV
jgi:phosphoribosyl-ATP pyrophosphohydrolase